VYRLPRNELCSPVGKIRNYQKKYSDTQARLSIRRRGQLAAPTDKEANSLWPSFAGVAMLVKTVND
jgi:hypothetical protein